MHESFLMQNFTRALKHLPFNRLKMLPKWAKQPTPSLAPKFDDLITILQTAKTFHSTTPNPIDNNCKKERAIISEIKMDIDDEKKYNENESTERYVTDLKGKETDTMKMVLNECKAKGLTSARLYRAPPQYYQEKIEWRRDILKAPHIKYLCKSLLMKNIRCIYKNCDDPTNSLYYLVIFQYVTRINSEKMMKFARKIHENKVGKKKFKFRLADSEANAIETGFKHNAVTPIGLKNKKIPIILSDRLLELGHFWMGGGEYDVKLAVDTKQFIKIYEPYVADIVYDGTIDPNENLDEEQENNTEDRPSIH
eukprot:141750_1